MTELDLMRAEMKARNEAAMSVYNGAELTDDGARYWLAMDGWDLEQAALLLHAIDPLRLNRWAEISGGRLEVAFPVQFDAAKALIARAFDAKALESPAKPADVIAWAKAKGLRLPRQFHDLRIAGAEPATETGTKATRKEARIAAIVETAKRLSYNPLSVPYGGKAAIERECLGKLAGEPCRFTADTFKSSWQDARDEGMIDVENAETYRGRQAGNPHGC